MKIDDILNDLNTEQKKAAKLKDGAILILAGAGTGKTKTITTRLAYLIINGVKPQNTLTLTFTNKAANEMKERALMLLKNLNYELIKEPMLCTFHSYALYLLRRWADILGYQKSFNIIDEVDKKRIIKNLIKNHFTNNEIDDEFKKNTSAFIKHIEKIKNELISEEEQLQNANINKENLIKHKIFLMYQQTLKDNNYMDFDDLLYQAYLLLKNNDDLRDKISQNLHYITVDEYQDTNKLQFAFLQLLSQNHQNICVVGDEDQCIYTFRGSKIDNILNFDKIYPNTQIIRLEENYRCTKNILNAANNLIKNNTQRLGKKLFTQKTINKEIKYIKLSDAKEEATYVANQIKILLQNGTKANDIAVLYRRNSSSIEMEKALKGLDINYCVIGSISFYERAEIKDAIAYLRLMQNPNDNIALLRVLNTPKRGLGEVFVKKMQDFSNANNCSYFTALELINVSAKQKKAIDEFIKIINEGYFSNDFKLIKENIYKLISKAYEDNELKTQKLDNLNDFFLSIEDNLAQGLQTLSDEINDLLLKSSRPNADENNSVALMSIHASKGLEFENVFLISLEEGIFPSGYTPELEEERRLCYVGITRAKTSLTLTSASFKMGALRDKSRFIDESLKNDILEHKTNKNDFIKNDKNEIENEINYKKENDDFFNQKSMDLVTGDVVKHKIFGVGKVLDVKKGGGNYAKISVSFGGIKKEIISSFLTKI